MIKFNERTQEFEEVSTPSGSALNEVLQAIAWTLYMIIGVLIFFLYAKKAFGVFLGIVYSLYWPISAAIDYFFLK